MTKFIEVEQKKDRSHPETDYSGCEDEHAVVELTDDFDLHYERDANDLEYEEIHKAKSERPLLQKETLNPLPRYFTAKKWRESLSGSCGSLRY